MARKHATAADAGLNPRLADDLGILRGGMMDAAEAHPLPPGFEALPTGYPRMNLVHAASGRSFDVGLYAYGAVREALMELFPEGLDATDGKGTRFETEFGDETIVRDLATGRSAVVPLFAAKAIAQTVGVIGDGLRTATMIELDGLAQTIEVEGGSLVRDTYPSAGQPAYRILDGDGERIGWIRRDAANHWTVVDPDSAEGQERTPHAVYDTLDEAVAHAEGSLSAQDSPRGP